VWHGAADGDDSALQHHDAVVVAVGTKAPSLLHELASFDERGVAHLLSHLFEHSRPCADDVDGFAVHHVQDTPDDTVGPGARRRRTGDTTVTTSCCKTTAAAATGSGSNRNSTI
jgi:hypothetical protein